MAIRRKKPGGLRSGFALSNAARNRMRTGDHFLESIHTYRLDREQFIVYVGAGDPDTEPGEDGEEPGVEYNMADRLDRNLTTLSGIDSQRPILIMLASCGGFNDEGLQMCEAILTCPNPITILTTKSTCSMASVIALMADRFLLRLVPYMYHRGNSPLEGIDQEVTTANKRRLKFQERMLYIYATRLKEQGIYKDLPGEEIVEILRREMEKDVDVWLEPYEAVRQGFADGVYTGDVKNLRAQEVNHTRRQRMIKMISLEFDVKTLIKPKEEVRW